MSWQWWCAALAVVGLAACSSSSDDATATTAAPASVATTAAPATTEATEATEAPAGVPSSMVAPLTVAVPTDQATTVPAPTAPATTATTGVAPEGFELVAGRVTASDGSTCDVCLWLAATAGARTQGLMGVTDLSGADGMVFRWDEPTTGNFWMRDTPLPLSIAFFSADGAFVSATDMTPCLQPTPDAECARYAAAGPYLYAVEVAVGGLEDLLMGPGSRLDLLAGGCPGA